jgi:hypothetical protein
MLHPEPQSGQLTAMGAGMAQALIDLDFQNDDNTAGSRRALLVVTDGMQNRLPVLTIDEPGTDIIDVTINSDNPDGINTYRGGDTDHSANDVGGGNYSGTVHYRKDPAGDVDRYIQVNTLGIGDHEPWQQNLAKAAQASRDEGEFLTNANGYTGVNEFFQAALTKVYSGNTPQTILKENGYFPTGSEKEIRYDFDLNRTVSSLAVVLSWAGDVPLGMTIRKGSTIIHAQLTPGSNSKVAVIEFSPRSWTKLGRMASSRPDFAKSPEKAYMQEFSISRSWFDESGSSGTHPEGGWSITIRPSSGFSSDTSGAVPYFLAVMAEEKTLRLDWQGAPAVVAQGSIWKAEVKISEADLFTSTIPSVSAQLTGPTIHPGTLLAEISSKIVKEILEKPEAGTLFAQLRDRAAADPRGSLAKIVRQLDKRVSLPVTVKPVLQGITKKERGRYRGILEASVRIPDRPGIYRVDIVVTGRGKACGPYHRVLSRSIIVPFKADPKNTIVEEGKEHWIVIPRDKNGIQLGPGSAASIKRRKAQKTQITDRGDGSYLVPKMKTGESKMEPIELIIEGLGIKAGL